jgi:hypothetical protein
MGKWEGGLISKDAAYRTQTSGGVSGVYSLQNQLRHHDAENWPKPQVMFSGVGGNTGFRIPVAIHNTDGGSSPNDSTVDFSVWYDDGTAGDFYVASSPSDGDTGRLYLCVKVTANTAYYNDLCLGAVQFSSDDWNQVDGTSSWSFSNSNDCSAWQRATVINTGSASAGYENWKDVINAPSQSWVGCTTGNTQGIWNRASSTGSSLTGAADGIDPQYSAAEQGTTTLLDGSTDAIEQQTGSTYLFTETSGQNMANKFFWLRSPEITLDSEADKRLGIVYHAYTHPSAGMTDTVGEPLLRAWWYTGGED